MDKSRRDFIKISSLALAGVVVNPFQSVITHENFYVNKKLGVLFYKPDGWGFIKVADFGKLKDKQVLGVGLEDSNEEIWKALGEPICIATKYFDDTDDNRGVFSPTIILKVTPKEELADLEAENFEEIIGMSHYGASMILRDFRIIKKIEPYLISGVKFYEFESEYLFEHTDIDGPLKVELTSLKAEHNGLYFDFDLHQSSAQNQTAGNEFRYFKSTIRLK